MLLSGGRWRHSQLKERLRGHGTHGVYGELFNGEVELVD